MTGRAYVVIFWLRAALFALLWIGATGAGVWIALGETELPPWTCFVPILLATAPSAYVHYAWADYFRGIDRLGGRKNARAEQDLRSFLNKLEADQDLAELGWLTLTHDTADARALVLRAIAIARLVEGDRLDARTLLEQALARTPRDTALLMDLAALCRLMSDEPACRAHREAAIALGENETQFDAALDLVKGYEQRRVPSRRATHAEPKRQVETASAPDGR